MSMGYTFGEEYDIQPLMDAFGSDFDMSSRDATTTVTGVLDTEWAESESGGIPIMQRIARILVRTNDVRLIAAIQCGGHMYQGEYEYTIREVMPEYGGLTTLVCQVRHAPL